MLFNSKILLQMDRVVHLERNRSSNLNTYRTLNVMMNHVIKNSLHPKCRRSVSILRVLIL